LVYKFMTGRGNLQPEALFEKVVEREGARTRLAAGANNLKLPAARTEIRRNSFAVRVVSGWNSLPDSVKQSSSCKNFKIALPKHLRNGGRPA
jgi:hypothetical protein